MIIKIISGITVLFAGDDKVLINGDTYGKEVWLSEIDNVDNWTEVDESEIPIQEEPVN